MNNEYKEYLSSEDWRRKKLEKLSRTKKRCAICGSTENIDLHHLNYRNLYDVVTSDLRFLCRRCHFLAHELHREGKIVFTSEKHHHRFGKIKAAVKRSIDPPKKRKWKRKHGQPSTLF